MNRKASEEIDVFQKTFDYLHKLLVVRGENESELTSVSKKRNETKFRLSDLQSFNTFSNDFRTNFLQNQQLNELQYETKRSLLMNLLEHLLMRSQIYNDHSKIHQETYFSYLSHQEQHMEIRLKELILEILGEYIKILLKAKELENNFVLNFYSRIIFLIWKTSWKNYINLFRGGIFQDRSINYEQENQRSKGRKITILDFEKDKNELKILASTNSPIKAFLMNQTVLPLVIIKITNPSARERMNNIDEPIIAETTEQLNKIFDQLSILCFPTSPSNENSTNSTQSKLSTAANEVVRFSKHFKNLSYCISSCNLWSEVTNFYYPSSAGTSNQSSSSSTSFINSLERFTLNYHVQQTTVLFQNMIFICLEEFSYKFNLYQKENGISSNHPLMITLQFYLNLEVNYISFFFLLFSI
jgi:hypothetical protein